jgi:hypothetical protein
MGGHGEDPQHFLYQRFDGFRLIDSRLRMWRAVYTRFAVPILLEKGAYSASRMAPMRVSKSA